MTVCLMWPYFNDLRWKVKWDWFDFSQNLIRYIFIKELNNLGNFLYSAEKVRNCLT